MKPIAHKKLLRTLAAFALIGAALGTPGLSVIASAQAAEVSVLGNLGSFRKIAEESSALIDKGDLSGAKTRLKDLETSWDEAESRMRPLSAFDWRFVDKAIDRALAAVRADSPTQANCKQQIKELLMIIDKESGK